MPLRFASRQLSLRIKDTNASNRPWRPLRRTMATMHNNKYDVVIIGGGVSGTALACSLGKDNTLSVFFPMLIVISCESGIARLSSSVS